MQNFLKKWFGGKNEVDAEIETNAVVRKKSKLESGATAIEYALIASLIAIAIITAVTNLGSGASNTFQDVADQLQ